MRTLEYLSALVVASGHAHCLCVMPVGATDLVVAAEGRDATCPHCDCPADGSCAGEEWCSSCTVARAPSGKGVDVAPPQAMEAVAPAPLPAALQRSIAEPVLPPCRPLCGRCLLLRAPPA